MVPQVLVFKNRYFIFKLLKITMKAINKWVRWWILYCINSDWHNFGRTFLYQRECNEVYRTQCDKTRQGEGERERESPHTHTHTQTHSHSLGSCSDISILVHSNLCLASLMPGCIAITIYLYSYTRPAFVITFRLPTRCIQLARASARACVCEQTSRRRKLLQRHRNLFKIPLAEIIFISGRSGPLLIQRERLINWKLRLNLATREKYKPGVRTRLRIFQCLRDLKIHLSGLINSLASLAFSDNSSINQRKYADKTQINRYLCLTDRRLQCRAW